MRKVIECLHCQIYILLCRAPVFYVMKVQTGPDEKGYSKYIISNGYRVMMLSSKQNMSRGTTVLPAMMIRVRFLAGEELAFWYP